MILYTYLPEQESALEPLLDLLLNDPAVLLHSFDLPVPGAKLERLGVLARAVIGTGLDQHPRFTQLVTYLEGQQAEMLTFLDWLELNLALWRRQAAHLITDPAQRAFFQATVARV